MATASQELAQFACHLRLSDVPEVVIEKVKAHTLDQIGAALVGGDVPWIQPVRRYGLQFGARGRSRVFGSRPGLLDTEPLLDAEVAALVNATAGHAWDIDDYHVATGHPGCVAVPTCLAIGEEQSASGARFLLATIVAFEVLSRVAISSTFSTASDRGFHSTSAYGVFGAAAGTACLLGFDATQLANALAIAGSHASGLSQAVSAGGQGRLHAGIGAAGGIRSARLAGEGLTGPEAIFEGERGFFHAFSAHPDARLLTKDLGEQWALMGCRLKPYPCAANILSPIVALQDILSANSIRPSEIQRIDVGVERLAPFLAGGPEPHDMMEAKFSTPFSLAMAAVKGTNDLATYREAERAGFKDPEILKVARTVTCHLDPECEAAYPEQWMSKVEVLTKDGKMFDAQASGPVDLSRSDVEAKFRGMMNDVLSADQMAAIFDMVSGLEAVGQIGELCQLLETPPALGGR